MGRLRKRVGLRSILVPSLGLLLLVCTLLFGIELAHRDARSEIRHTFELKGRAAAAFASSFVTEQATREAQTASRLLSARRVPETRFELVASTFGDAALLLDARGRVLDVTPASSVLVGTPIANRYAHLRAAEAGRVSASNVVPSAVKKEAVVAVAVPVATRFGRRVFSVGYNVNGSELAALVAHTVAYSQHKVYLVDSNWRLLAASPATAAGGIPSADPQLARAVSRTAQGEVTDGGVASSFTSADVPGTSWRLVISVPDSRLFASTAGLPQIIDWIVLGLVAILGSFLLLLIAHGARVRSRLATEAAITQTMTEGVMLVSVADELIEFTNASFDAMLGYEPGELIGRHVSTVDAGGPKGHEATRELITSARDAGGPLHAEVENARKDGTSLWCTVNITALDHGEHGPVWVAVHSDITARRKAELAAEVALADAVDASQAKSRFVANMSHEIRTPLNGVVGMTNLLCDTALDPVQREYVDALSASNEALMSVINDVLDFSRLESGQFELDPTDFDLHALIESACIMFAGPAQAKGIEISHWVGVDVPSSVHGDRGRLRQILLNLLSNAVKFTSSGEIVLRTSTDQDDLLSFEVRDTGTGIDESQAQHLFSAFSQADPSTTREYGGTGLGLAISRELATRMGGEIGARRADPGSVFWFTARLPRVEQPGEPLDERLDLRGAKLLIADDHQTNRAILESYLQGWGVCCDSVATAAEALEALKQAAADGAPYELALIDFNLPRMNGAQLLREVDAHPALHGLHAVILSSSPLTRAAFKGQRIPPVLAKPARQSDLYEALANAMIGASPRIDIEQANEGRPRIAGLPVLVAEDNEINRAVAKALLAKQGKRAVFAHNGREAVEMALADRYAAILMDCQMPELDGYQATRTIRSRESGDHVPIIAMTAHSMPGDRERCLAAGMDDYVSKPVHPEQLTALLTRWVRDDGSPAPLDAEIALAPVEGRQLKTLDEETVEELREALTGQTRAQLLDTFAESLSSCVSEIEEAFERNDRDEIRRVVHLLKGSSATLGAAELRDACQRLEHTDRPGDPPAIRQLEQLKASIAISLPALREALG